jgi:hypothetical protein
MADSGRSCRRIRARTTFVAATATTELTACSVIAPAPKHNGSGLLPRPGTRICTGQEEDWLEAEKQTDGNECAKTISDGLP